MKRRIIALIAAALTLCPPGAWAADKAAWVELEVQMRRLLAEERYAELIPVAEQAARVAQEVYGPEDLRLVLAISSLGHAHRMLAKDAIARYGALEFEYLRALRILEYTYDPDHRSVAVAANNLADLYKMEGRYAEAEAYSLRALDIWERLDGPEHPNVALACNNLAMLYKTRGRFEKAEALYRRAKQIFEVNLMTDHPMYALLSHNLQTLLDQRGEVAEAEEAATTAKRREIRTDQPASNPEAIYKLKLAALEDTLGPDHPNVAVILKALADLYKSRGREDEAETTYKRALAIEERQPGLENQEKAALTIGKLIDLYHAQERYDEAEPLHRRFVSTLERVVGEDSPDLAPALERYAVCLEKLGKKPEAIALRDRAQRVIKKPSKPSR